LDTSSILPTLNVLVIDDSATMRALLTRTLVHNNVGRIVTAASGEEGLRLLEDPTREINLVLCDWNMPGMSGIEFCRKLKVAKPALPIVMLTARADPDSMKKAREAGIDSYLVKPVSPAELIQKIRFTWESRVSPMPPAITPIDPR
jgi:two-component system, chemotaxis family, chemotaxis protein CheY